MPSELLTRNGIVDRYWAGMLAGGASWIFGEDVDVEETRCVADGKESCEFVVVMRGNDAAVRKAD